jgi:hypothetical protein
MFSAACHCGAVEVQFARKPRQLTQCTCSICRRYAALWAYFTTNTAQITRGWPDQVVGYSWKIRKFAFYHCSSCGCVVFYRGTGNRRLAVNARMLPREDIEGVRVRTFDGAKSWRYID